MENMELNGKITNSKKDRQEPFCKFMRIIILDYEVVVYFTVTLHHITLQQQLSSLVMDLLTWLQISVEKNKTKLFQSYSNFPR